MTQVDQGALCDQMLTKATLLFLAVATKLRQVREDQKVL